MADPLADAQNALEVGLAAISPALATSNENVTYTPVVGTAYQVVTLAPADPDDRVIGAKTAQQGFLQIELRYPLNQGRKPAQDRIALIRAKFPPGASFTSGSTTAMCGALKVMTGFNDADRYVVIVRLPFTTNFG